LREGDMNENRFFHVLYGVMVIPIIAIIGFVVWGFVFLAAQSNPDAILGWGALFVVWLVFVLEGLNKEIFNRRALPWLPLIEPFIPLPARFVPLLAAYALFGFIAYKMVTEPW
jgi:hypothetical protein